MVIVVTGAAVRLTGSGLGCDDWPNCNDQQLVDVSSGHAAIEQVNRLFTGLVAFAVIAAVLGSLWRQPRRRDLTWLSLGLVAGVLGQIVLGGITVLVDLHPVAVQGHMLLSQALVAVRRRAAARAGEPDGGRRRPSSAGRRRRLVVGARDGDRGGDRRRHRRHGRRTARRRRGRRGASTSTIADAARVHGTLVLVAVALAVVLGDPAAAPRRRPPGAAGRAVVVDLRRPAAGRDRLHPVLQRRPGAARRPPRRRGDGAVGDDRVARAGHSGRRRRRGPWTSRRRRPVRSRR